MVDSGEQTSSSEEVSPQGPFIPTQLELLTAQFYVWEARGRGWWVHPTPVDIEPPFIPFKSHSVSLGRPAIDDGRRPTVLSRIAERVAQLLSGDSSESPSLSLEVSLPEEPEPQVDEDGSSIVEFRLSVPPPLKVTPDVVLQLLTSLPVSIHPLAFEVVGLSGMITVQVAVREPEAALIEQHLRAYFPDVVVTREEEHLRSWWVESRDAPAVVVDFGLANEFMLPMRTYRTFDVDPLIGTVAALSDLRLGEVGVLQVMLQPTRHPWPESIMRAVMDYEGKPFFLDAPEITKAAKEKVSRPLFAAVIRIGVKSPDLSRCWEVARALAGSLRNLANPAGNELIPLTNDSYDSQEHEWDLLQRRSRRNGMLLNVEELVSLVHPPSMSVRSEKLKRQERKTRAAPAIATGEGILLGSNTHAGQTTKVRLTPDQRSKHMYTVGASGTGKSTLLLHLIVQDLRNGEGVAVLDPHGDLIDRVIEYVPEERIDDVILFDPADGEYPVGFNILSAHSELERTLLSSDLVSVFRRLSTSWGDQMTSVLGNALLAFLESDRGGTLLDLRRFLVEKRFREEILATVKDPDVVFYWRKEFPLLKGTPQVSILTRLDTFLRPKLVRYMVAQKDDRLDFRGIMDCGKVFLARLSQGAIGEENAHLLGTLLVSKLQQIAMSRQELAEVERRPFYVYIDEFQNFITPTMEQILSAARKYRLGLILAHQDLRQLASRSPEVLNSVISNPYTRVCFRVGDQDARRLEDGFASFEATDLQNLGTGQAICRVERAEYDFSLDTPWLPRLEAEHIEKRRRAIVERSRAKYARSRGEVESLLRTTTPEVSPPQSPAAAAEKPAEPVHQRTTKPPSAETDAPPKAKEPIAPPADVAPPAPDRGGRQHRYLQELVKRWADSREWRATIEEKILEGLGSVDVALRKGDRSVACEIAITTDATHEIDNVQKCLTAGFERIVLISSDKRTLSKVESVISSELPEEEHNRVHYCTPEDAFALLENIDAETTGTTKTVRGYKVKVKYKSVGEREQQVRRQAVSQVIARALRRLKSKD